MSEYNYIDDRLTPQIKYYSEKAARMKTRHFLATTLEILAAATIPVLVGYTQSTIVSIIIAILGASVAAITGLRELFRWHVLWQEFRTTAESLKHELHLYNSQATPYNLKNRDKVLSRRCEQLISEQNTTHFPSIAEKTEAGAD